VLTTWLTARFDVAVPVVSAPMAGAAGGRLAAAVSTAGGLGMIGVGDAATPSWVRQEASIAAEGGAPYGVGLLAWSRPERTGQLAAVLDAPTPPALVSVSYGDPPGDERRYLPALHAAGIVVATQVGSRADAVRAAGDGFDLLVVRGGEGGGHGRDAVATLPLLQEVLTADLGAELPVLAAGGIATDRGLAAVLAAGAAGAWVGTAFLASQESAVPTAAKARLLGAASTDTVYTHAFDRGLSLGWPAEFGGRSLRNSFTDTWTGRESELAHAQGARDRLTAARGAGDYDQAGIYAGQAVGLVQAERPAAEILIELAAAEALLRRW
jgi:nitronate monooxygenase